MNFIGPALNFLCIGLVALSLAIFWRNKQWKNEITQLAIETETLKIHLENIHQTCRDEVVAAFPRMPATHIVTHSEREVQDLRIKTNVTVILLYLVDKQGAWPCLKIQVKSITDAFPGVKIFTTVVTENAKNIKPVPDSKTIGIFRDKATALNMAVRQVNTPYFLVLESDFVIEPKGSDTGIEWLHHALVVTPGVDIIGGSVLLTNNELVVPCYSLSLCNWTLIQKYEYKRSFGEIMICDEASHSFMARKDIIPKFNNELFDKDIADQDYMFVDFFLQAKKLQLTVANRPEVLFVQERSCVQQPLPKKAKMNAALPLARKHQIIQFKDPENKMRSICDGSSSGVCTTKKMVEDFRFPNWYGDGMFAYPFVVKQAIHTLEIISEKLQKAGITFALRGETLFGAVMTKSVLPWGKLDAIHLSVFGVKTEMTRFATSNGFQHSVNGDTVVVLLDVPNFSNPMKVEIFIKPLGNAKFVNIRVNGKLYPALSDPIAELIKEYGKNYLLGEDSYTEAKFSCRSENHHACLPAMQSRGASTYEENYCEI